MRFSVLFNQTTQRLRVEFESNEKRLNVGFSDFQALTVKPDVEYYEGSFDVIPAVSEQVLATADKYMTSDVTVQAIPYFDVGNTAGGSTVYIGTAAEMAVTQ